MKGLEKQNSIEGMWRHCKSNMAAVAKQQLFNNPIDMGIKGKDFMNEIE